MKEKINVIKDNKKDSGLRFPTNTSLILFFLKGSIFYFTAGAVFACLVALFDLIIPRLIQYTVDAVIGGNLSTLTAVLSTAYDSTETDQPYILLLEDVEEDYEHIHRYLTVLKHFGVLDRVHYGS